MDNTIRDEAKIIGRYTEEADSMLERYRSYSIKTGSDYEVAALILKTVKTKYEEVESVRKSLTRPIDESKKRIMELFRRPLSALETVETCIKKAMLEYQQKTEIQGAEIPKVTGVSKRTIWRARVINDKLVPREFLKVDEQALEAFASATKGTAQIPGVEFYSEEIIVSKK